MIVLLDTNVVLDVLLDRIPFVTDSAAVWRAADTRQFRGYLAATTLPTVFYIVEREAGTRQAADSVGDCLDAFAIVSVSRETLLAARAMTGTDFEDNVQIACALAAGADYIVTRNPADFAASPIPVLTPADFLARLPRPAP